MDSLECLIKGFYGIRIFVLTLNYFSIEYFVFFNCFYYLILVQFMKFNLYLKLETIFVIEMKGLSFILNSINTYFDKY